MCMRVFLQDQLLALRSESLEGLELIYQHMSATMTEVQSTLDTILVGAHGT